MATPTTAVLSPTQPTTTAIGASASPSTGGQVPTGGAPGISPAGSSLYLFTFLTTLLLLLGVSCAIIIRSLVLRRRFRRRVAEAIANGVFVPGLMERPVRDIGEKPKMFDIYLGEPSGNLDVNKTDSTVQDPQVWNKILPVSATKVAPLSAGNPPTTPTGVTPTTVQTPPQTIFSRFMRRNRQTPPVSSPGTPSPSSLESQTQQHQQVEKTGDSSTSKSTKDDKDKDVSQIQVSLLIAMPSASRPSSHFLSGASTSSLSHSHEEDPKGKLKAASTASVWSDLEEGEIPHLELGVLEVGYRGEKPE